MTDATERAREILVGLTDGPDCKHHEGLSVFCALCARTDIAAALAAEREEARAAIESHCRVSPFELISGEEDAICTFHADQIYRRFDEIRAEAREKAYLRGRSDADRIVAIKLEGLYSRCDLFNSGSPEIASKDDALALAGQIVNEILAIRDGEREELEEEIRAEESEP